MDIATIAEGAAEVTLSIIGLAFPVSLPFIAIAKEAIPAIMAAKPYIEKAVQNGKSAFHAAENAAPDLGDKIRKLAKYIPAIPGISALEHLDNVTMATAGYAVPGWTDQQTKAWMDNATPNNDPSQENSQHTVG